MSLFNIFDITGSALSAQSVRLNTVASNLANADVPSATVEGVYRSRQPIFATLLQQAGVQTLGLEQNAGWTQAAGKPPFMPSIPTDDYERFLSTVDPEASQTVPENRTGMRTTSPRVGG